MCLPSLFGVHCVKVRSLAIGDYLTTNLMKPPLARESRNNPPFRNPIFPQLSPKRYLRGIERAYLFNQLLPLNLIVMPNRIHHLINRIHHQLRSVQMNIVRAVSGYDMRAVPRQLHQILVVH